MVEIQYFGHSFFKIRFSQRNVLIDPFLNCNPKDPVFERLVECNASPRALHNIDVILVTHEHFDHFDKKAIEEIVAGEDCCVVAHDHILQELQIPTKFRFSIKMNQEITLRGMQIKALAAHHPNAFYPLSFLISYGKERVFHAGDTDLINDFSEVLADVVMLPIGGTFTMDCVDAVRAIKTMKPRYAIPMHFNTFKMIQQDPLEFKHKIERSVLKTKPLVLKPGQKVKIRL